jgi:hypothetical protein
MMYGENDMNAIMETIFLCLVLMMIGTGLCMAVARHVDLLSQKILSFFYLS